MVWGMISAEGIGPLVRLHGRVNAAVDKELVKQHGLHVLRNAANQPGVFMQDNAPCHKANTVRSFFKEENVIVTDWPAQSTDINTIEIVCKILGEYSKAKHPKTTEQLWTEPK